ncbi:MULTISPECIES: hypothetical protein [unclassified Faecalibacterium]|uniref:hypothetical protein n=1 Tax=unclassified Faecalibacterium TaxID=2646395 RepID=UPI000B37C595|nr:MULTISPECIES: hypothetical protein [unclassified Faecalibacterium]OUP28107.1 hypothetical protein B5F27_07835 [Faecalibacterium sp. An192]OUQ36305.1 hypothetical protein B5E67_10735 [Faecalibacterium sp. An122]
MEKYLVEIRIPSQAQTLDALLPPELTIGQAVELICQMTGDPEHWLARGQTAGILCNAQTGGAYPPDLLISESSICNGTRLILF